MNISLCARTVNFNEKLGARLRFSMRGLLGAIIYLSLPYTTILEQLNPNIVTEEVKTKVIKTKYGKVQGFISRVGRDASTAKFVQVFLGIPYASPPTGNYR